MTAILLALSVLLNVWFIKDRTQYQRFVKDVVKKHNKKAKKLRTEKELSNNLHKKLYG